MAIRNPELTAKRKEMFKGKNNPNYGNNWTDEMKQQMSEKKKGLKAYNNGVICVMARECPGGFVPGGLKKEKSTNDKTRSSNNYLQVYKASNGGTAKEFNLCNVFSTLF